MPERIAGQDWLTIGEVAAELRVTPRTVNTYIKTGQIRASKIGKRWMMTSEAVKEHIDRRSNIKSRPAA